MSSWRTRSTSTRAWRAGAGPAFTYRTSAPGRDSVFAGAGINTQIGRDWMVGAYYNIDFASSTALDHIVSLNLSYGF
jgi:uncharacterized protein with beta-barrel porin domain